MTFVLCEKNRGVIAFIDTRSTSGVSYKTCFCFSEDRCTKLEDALRSRLDAFEKHYPNVASIDPVFKSQRRLVGEPNGKV